MWFLGWTGNEEVGGHEFLVFSQDGTGGCAAFWLVRAGKPAKHALGERKSPSKVLGASREEFPDFDERMRAVSLMSHR